MVFCDCEDVDEDRFVGYYADGVERVVEVNV